MTTEERSILNSLQDQMRALADDVRALTDSSRATSEAVIRLSTQREACYAMCQENYRDINSQDRNNPGLKVQVQELASWSSRWHKVLWFVLGTASGIVGPLIMLLIQHLPNLTHSAK